MIFYIAFILGVFSANFVNLSNVYLALFICITCVVAFTFLVYIKSKLNSYNILLLFAQCVMIFGISFGYCGSYILYSKWHMIDQSITRIKVTGVISGLITHREKLDKFNFTVTDGYLSGKVLQVYSGNYQADNSDMKLKAGNKYVLLLSVFKPNYSNTKIFLQQGVDGSATVVKVVENLGQNFSFMSFITRIRYDLVDYISNSLYNEPYAGLIVALVTGDQSYIPKSQWQMFKSTGIIHLVSISGLHISLVAAVIMWIAKFALRYVRVFNIPRQLIVVWVGIITALLYSLLSGFSIPTQRTFYMILIFGFLTMLREKVPPIQVLVITAAIILFLDPFASQSIGFYMSLGLVATIFIIANQELYSLKYNWLLSWLKMQYAITLVSIPIVVYLFNSYPMISSLVNLWAIPTIGNIITPVALLSSIFHCKLLLQLSDAFLNYAMYPIELLRNFPMYSHYIPNITLVLLSYLGVIILLIPKSIRGKNIFGIILFNCIFLNHVPILKDDEIMIDTIANDVIIQMHNETFVVTDGDTRLAQEEINLLKSREIEKVNLILKDYKNVNQDEILMRDMLVQNNILVDNIYNFTDSENTISNHHNIRILMHPRRYNSLKYIAIYKNNFCDDIIIPKQIQTDGEYYLPYATNLIFIDGFSTSALMAHNYKNVLLLSSLQNMPYLIKNIDNLFIEDDLYTNFEQERYEIDHKLSGDSFYMVNGV